MARPVESQILDSELEENGYDEFKQDVIEDIVELKANELKDRKLDGFLEDIEELGIEADKSEIDNLEGEYPEFADDIGEIKEELEDDFTEEIGELEENVTEAVRNDPENRIKHNLDLLGLALSINNEYREKSEHRDIEPLEIRGGAVFAHVYEEVGNEAFLHWPKIWDTDKYVPAGRDGKEEDRRNVEKIFANNYGDIIRQSQNSENHQGDKYTVDFDILPQEAETEYGCGRGFEVDLIQPKIPENSEYSFDEEDTTRIEFTSDLSMKVPSIDEMIRHKGTITRENSDGNDEFREKDGTELLTLLYVAENREVTPEELEETYEPTEYAKIADRLEDVVPDMNRDIPGSYLPTDDYIEEFIGRSRKYDLD